MRKFILAVFSLLILLCVSSSSYALDFIKFGTGHDEDFWATPNSSGFDRFPSTVQYLQTRGKNEITSIPLTDNNVQDVFNRLFGGFDAIVVSERIEKLSPESYALFNQYVSDGGCLILTGSHGDEPDFLNNAFGFSVSSTDAVDGVDAYSIQPSATGTVFDGGPNSLIAANHTLTFSNTPGSEIYSSPTGVAVFTGQFGNGVVTAIGWDYCCTPPNNEGQILDWYEVVNRAFDQCAPKFKPVIPTLSEWGLISMAGILGIFGVLAVRRRKVTA